MLLCWNAPARSCGHEEPAVIHPPNIKCILSEKAQVAAALGEEAKSKLACELATTEGLIYSPPRTAPMWKMSMTAVRRTVVTCAREKVAGTSTKGLQSTQDEDNLGGQAQSSLSPGNMCVRPSAANDTTVAPCAAGACRCRRRSRPGVTCVGGPRRHLPTSSSGHGRACRPAAAAAAAWPAAAAPSHAGGAPACVGRACVRACVCVCVLKGRALA